MCPVTNSVSNKPPVPALNDYVAPWPGELVEVGTRQVFVRHAPPTGANPQPAVFIHGLGGSSTNWTELMSLLDDAVDGIAPDLAGHGQSPPAPDGDYKLATHARIVAEVVRQRFGDQKVHIFGNSLGGATAVQLAAGYPELVRTLTLISPALPDYVPRMTNIHMPVIAVPGVGEKLTEKFAQRETDFRVHASLDLCYADTRRIPPQRLADAIEEAKIRDAQPYANDALLASLRGLIGTYLDKSATRPWKLAEKITAPTLLIYGRKDKLVNPKAAHRATKAFPNAAVMVIPDSGHVSQMEHPELVAAAWRQLVAAPQKSSRSSTR